MDRRKFLQNTLMSSVTVYAVSAIDYQTEAANYHLPAAFNPVKPLFTTIDLDLGEETVAGLSDGTSVRIRLVSIEGEHEKVTRTLTGAKVRVSINGTDTDLVCSSYHLPVEAGGVQADVPVIKNYMEDSHIDWWKLKKAARIRLWPAGSKWIEPGTFKYPVKQRWFASMTSYSNEPVSRRANGKVYYHSGIDFGAVDGLTEIVAATDGKIISLGDDIFGERHPALDPRYDVIYVEDSRGWIYRYSHMSAFDPSLKPGTTVRMGQRLGYVGKEGGSGGWSHLHFHIESLQPTGEWGVEDSYAFLWQAYCEKYNPPVLAVARPHFKVFPGEEVILDASRSLAKRGIKSYEWTFTDGTTGVGPKVKRIYNKPGSYSEIVRVTDISGNTGYDIARVRVYPEVNPDGTASVVGVHVVHHPSFGIKPGDPVLFRSRGRSLNYPGGDDIYDFGDGSPKVAVPSNIDPAQHASNGYGTIVHHYKKSGDYFVRVEREDTETGFKAIDHIHVVVE